MTHIHHILGPWIISLPIALHWCVYRVPFPAFPPQTLTMTLETDTASIFVLKKSEHTEKDPLWVGLVMNPRPLDLSFASPNQWDWGSPVILPTYTPTLELYPPSSRHDPCIDQGSHHASVPLKGNPLTPASCSLHCSWTGVCSHNIWSSYCYKSL